MRLLNSTWSWLAAIFVVAILSFALTSGVSTYFIDSDRFDDMASAANSTDNNAENHAVALSSLNIPDNSAPDNSSLTVAIDPRLPLPAQKLQKLIGLSEPELALVSDQDIADRIDALDQQIEAMNQELIAQGIAVPSRQSSVDTNISTKIDHDTDERLSVVNDFISEKESPITTN